MKKNLLFEKECAVEIKAQGKDVRLSTLSTQWMEQASQHKYSYHFKWLGRPIIQYPADIIGMHEIIFQVKPDLIIETGIAHGGGLIFYASMLELNAICGGPADARVLGIDIDIRVHNRKAIEEHPMFRRITLFEGSSVDNAMVQKVIAFAKPHKNILVCLDSNHTHEHVLAELEAYAPLVACGNYCVVFDTVIEQMAEGSFPHRPWDRGNNPMTAVDAFINTHPEFIIDDDICSKLAITGAPKGFLKRNK